MRIIQSLPFDGKSKHRSLLLRMCFRSQNYFLCAISVRRQRVDLQNSLFVIISSGKTKFSMASCLNIILDSVFIIKLFLNFRFDRKEAELLSALNRLEVERETDTSTLFRADNLTTSIMERYMKSVCTDFLQTAIHPTIHRLVTIITYSILKILPYKMCHDYNPTPFQNIGISSPILRT